MSHRYQQGNRNNSMMSRSRYEPVPQVDEIIELSDPSYNYNTAIPNSPPPSFHSSQSTPAVSVIGDHDFDHDRAFNNSTPRPIPSVSAATGRDASSTTDALLITNLHRRVERLEESLGRLLLEKSERDGGGGPLASGKQERSNCCVTFPDISALTDSERGELLGRSGSSNCCVTFGGRRKAQSEEEKARREHRRAVVAVVGAVFVMFCIMGWIALLTWLKHRPAVLDCASCGWGKGKEGWSAAGQDENGSWSESG